MSAAFCSRSQAYRRDFTIWQKFARCSLVVLADVGMTKQVVLCIPSVLKEARAPTMEDEGGTAVAVLKRPTSNVKRNARWQECLSVIVVT